MTMWFNKWPEITGFGTRLSAVAVHAASRVWLFYVKTAAKHGTVTASNLRIRAPIREIRVSPLPHLHRI